MVHHLLMTLPYISAAATTNTTTTTTTTGQFNGISAHVMAHVSKVDIISYVGIQTWVYCSNGRC